MTAHYFFNQITVPSAWKYKGINNTVDDNEEITVYGFVFDDCKSKIIRICFTKESERFMIVERTRSTNYKGPNYKTVCNIRADELDRVNEFITKRYIL